jgi:hypothetical protein
LELKDPRSIIAHSPYGWWALHTAMAHASQMMGSGSADLSCLAHQAVRWAVDAGFVSQPNECATRFLGMPIAPFQDALFVVNELPEWHFPDEVLHVAWLVECGGPSMGRGPAGSGFASGQPEHTIGDARILFNAGAHGNGPGWPKSTKWPAAACRHMASVSFGI